MERKGGGRGEGGKDGRIMFVVKEGPYGFRKHIHSQGRQHSPPFLLILSIHEETAGRGMGNDVAGKGRQGLQDC